MKKILYSAALVCMLAAVVSCKSTKGGKKASKKVKAPAVTEAAAEGEGETGAGATETPEASSTEEKKQTVAEDTSVKECK